jgi:hypothetical protein
LPGALYLGKYFEEPLMQKIVLPIILLLILASAAGQASVSPGIEKPLIPRVTTIPYQLGDRILQIKTYQYGAVKDLVYINLHDDEVTAVNGARKILEKKGGFLIRIENYRTRNIKFRLDGKYYTIDPNRMFSRTGIIHSLIIFGKTSDKAIDEVERFANRILQLIPSHPSYVIALHNNSNGRYSINSFLPGGVHEKDAKLLYINPEQDADDIFLTTDSVLFHQLVDEKYNAVLQDNEKAKKDGSLSIYCGEKNIRYVNCETEHGRQEQYDEMIVSASNHITGSNPDAIAYHYQVLQQKEYIPVKKEAPVFFGEKKVGLIRPVRDSATTAPGILEMDKSFSLYSNMDFFLFRYLTTSPRFEVRIDPTRSKELIDPAKAIVRIKAVR